MAAKVSANSSLEAEDKTANLAKILRRLSVLIVDDRIRASTQTPVHASLSPLPEAICIQGRILPSEFISEDTRLDSQRIEVLCRKSARHDRALLAE